MPPSSSATMARASIKRAATTTPAKKKKAPGSNKKPEWVNEVFVGSYTMDFDAPLTDPGRTPTSEAPSIHARRDAPHRSGTAGTRRMAHPVTHDGHMPHEGIGHGTPRSAHRQRDCHPLHQRNTPPTTPHARYREHQRDRVHVPSQRWQQQHHTVVLQDAPQQPLHRAYREAAPQQPLHGHREDAPQQHHMTRAPHQHCGAGSYGNADGARYVHAEPFGGHPTAAPPLQEPMGGNPNTAAAGMRVDMAQRRHRIEAVTMRTPRKQWQRPHQSPMPAFTPDGPASSAPSWHAARADGGTDDGLAAGGTGAAHGGPDRQMHGRGDGGGGRGVDETSVGPDAYRAAQVAGAMIAAHAPWPPSATSPRRHRVALAYRQPSREQAQHTAPWRRGDTGPPTPTNIRTPSRSGRVHPDTTLDAHTPPAADAHGDGAVTPSGVDGSAAAALTPGTHDGGRRMSRVERARLEAMAAFGGLSFDDVSVTCLSVYVHMSGCCYECNEFKVLNACNGCSECLL